MLAGKVWTGQVRAGKVGAGQVRLDWCRLGSCKAVCRPAGQGLQTSRGLDLGGAGPGLCRGLAGDPDSESPTVLGVNHSRTRGSSVPVSPHSV